MNPVVIDISHHQPDPIDWAWIEADGTIGVIHKATEGTSYVDDKLFTRMKGAKAAGLLTCTYHFLKHGSINAQMAHYLNTIDPVPGERVVIDYEDPACTTSDLTAAVDYLRSANLGLQITVYGASKLTDDARGHADALRDTSLWAARYSSNEPVIATDVWPIWSLWQYTDKASINGINGYVDGNKWNGTEESLRKWLAPADSAPAPVPIPNVFEVRLTIPEGQAYAIYINGVLQ